MNSKHLFCLNNFQKWLRKEVEEHSEEIKVESHVVASVPIKKIIERAEIHDGDVFEIAKCFRKNGGIVESVVNDILTIKTKKGTFSIHDQDVRVNN
jgi:hypothetical protein